MNSIEDRFWSKVEKTDSCWLWTAYAHKSGYGQFDHHFAHRAAWVLVNGPIPAGLLVLHRCDVRPCVNPSHLFLGTQSDNIRDMYAKGRRTFNRQHSRDVMVAHGWKGERHPMAKLSDKEAHVVLRLRDDGWKQWQIAYRFSVSQATISHIWTGVRKQSHEVLGKLRGIE